MSALPTGTITFLFTDIEGSTRLWETHPEAMRLALARHDRLMRQAIEMRQGYVFKTVGDAFCAAFASAPLALQAALEVQLLLAAEVWDETGPLRVRMGLHTGTAEERDHDYFGPTVNRVARLQSAGHGQQILLSEATAQLVQGDLPPAASLLEKGRHRLKDLNAPETVWQILHPDLPADYPPLKTLDTLSNNLPQQVSSFIGREREIDAIQRLLTAGRLVTLVGTGGIGKTRLALQAAADRIEHFADGVWIVELAALTDPSLIPQAVAAALSLHEESGQDLMQTLLDYLKPKKLLLLLDNCEHLIEPAARFVDTLLRRCPDLRVLATSREGLDLPGEHLYPVPSLGLPTGDRAPLPDRIRDFDACRLLIDRATQLSPDLALTDSNAAAVTQICRQLDGIPLAIELAAARVKSLPLEQISLRLNDRFRLLTGGSRAALPRQQTLRALVDWSYELLNDAERTLFRRLSVFSGGWTLAMAEPICTGKDLERWEVLDLLARLVEKSLVMYEETNGEARYRMLETLRQYGSEKLGEAVETATVRTAHCDFLHSFLVEAGPRLYGGEEVVWLARLETEQDNLRSALDWCEQEQKQVDPSLSETHRQKIEQWLSMVSILERFWEIRGLLREGRQRIEVALAFRRETDPRCQSRALNAAGILACADRDYVSADAYHQESLQVKRTLGDKGAIATALNNLAVVADGLGDYDTMQRYLTESLEIYRSLNLTLHAGAALSNLGVATSKQGQYANAQCYYEESLLLVRASGMKSFLSILLHNLGDVMLRQGAVDRAEPYLRESVQIRTELCDTHGLICSLERLATAAVQQGRFEIATRRLGAAEAARIQTQVSRALSDAHDFERDKEEARSHLTREAFALAWEQGLQESLQQALRHALTPSVEDGVT